MSTTNKTVVYLVNADAGFSEMCWYNNIDNSLRGETPDQVSQITQAGSDIIWEGYAVTGSFGLRFTSYVNPDAHSQPAGTIVGTANYGPIFAAPPPGSPPGSVVYYQYTIYRDNDRVLYSNAAVGNCTSIYVCTTAQQLVTGPPPPSPGRQAML